MMKHEPRSPAALAWRRLRRNKPAWYSLIFIVLCMLLAAAGPLVLPDSSPYANRQLLEISLQRPGFETYLLKRPITPAPPSGTALEEWWQGRQDVVSFMAMEDYTVVGDNLVYQLFTGDNSKLIDSIQLRELGLPAGTEETEISKDIIEHKTYWLGTDRFGRDMLSRLLLGTRVSLTVGLLAVSISLLIGVTLGAMAGFFRGWVDSVILWFIQVVWSIPTVLLVAALSVALGRGLWQVFVAVGLTMWVEVARVVRGQLLSVRELEYVTAGRALGYGSGRLVVRHILPNIVGPVLVISAANFASAILLEAGLSFLGLGVQPPLPSWGVMVNEHLGYLVIPSLTYLALLPGLAIMFLVMAFNLLGNGLRDALDVRMR